MIESPPGGVQVNQASIGRRLQVCRENSLARQAEILEALRMSGWKVETEDCLDQCTRCGHCAFALVGGWFQYAPTPQDFLGGLTRRSKGRIRSTIRGKKTGRGGGSHAQE